MNINGIFAGGYETKSLIVPQIDGETFNDPATVPPRMNSVETVKLAPYLLT